MPQNIALSKQQESCRGKRNPISKKVLSVLSFSFLSSLDLGRVVTRVHAVLLWCQEVELLVLDLLAGDGEHGLGETHGLEVGQS